MKHALLAAAALTVSTTASAQDVGVVICDVAIGQNVLDQLAIHGITGVHYEDAVSPTLNQLQGHDVVIWSPCSRLPQIETVVTDYHLTGGPLVVTGAYGEGTDGTGYGDWLAAGLDFLVSPVPGNFDPPLDLVASIPGHPLVVGVNSYRGDAANYRSAGAVMALGTVAAEWADGVPLAVDVSPGLVYLNTWPANNLISNQYVLESSDEDVLLANAVWFALGGGCVDLDGDGLCEGVDDLCLGDNSTGDTDSDGVCDDWDVCAGFDDTFDVDGDYVPDGCDACPFDNPDDDDGDGVCNSVDACLGFDDALDADLDGTPDGCDVCAGFDDALDADGDGVPDDCDLCPGGDDGIDSDADGAADFCDVCPNDPLDDDDADGVCGDVDLCEGSDDAVDDDADGVPDGCDICFGTNQSGDEDGDGACAAWQGQAYDCNDTNPALYPGATEVCDGLDTDCDGALLPEELDGDADGVTECDGDCDPGDPAVHPLAVEVCDGIDNDCDGTPGPDELDVDGDGFLECDTDCDDDAAEVGPGMPELCDGLDNDCDGVVDDDCSGGDGKAGGCGCDQGVGGVSWAWMGALTFLVLRRRRD